MYGKGTFNNINDSHSRSESTERLCKSPRLVLTKLNIPLNSVVLVKGDSVIFPENSSNKSPSESNNTNITVSDDDLSNDEDFQKMVIRRFQSTKDRGSDEMSESHNPSKRLEQADSNDASHQTSSTNDGPQTVKTYYSYGPKSRRKLLPHPKTIRKKIKAMSNIADKTTPEQLLQSDSDGETDENAVFNVDEHANESNAVSSNTSFVSSNKTNINKNSSVVSKSGHTSNKINIDEDVAEIIAMLEDSPVEREENEKDITENKKETNATQPEFTPSRISQRIKNKKVKFSALRLLAGGEIPSSKKKVQTNSLKKTSTPKKFVKTKANSTADINANNSNLSPIAREESVVNKAMQERISNPEKEDHEDSIVKPQVNKSVPHKQIKQYTNVKKPLTSKNKLIGNSEKKSSPPPEKVISSSSTKEKETLDLGSTNSRKKNNLNETRTNGSEELLEKNSVVRENLGAEVNNKVRVELQEAPQRKVINITISPKKSLKHEGSQKENLKEKKDIDLGPDIIIRKIKSGKKQEIEKIDNGQDSNADKSVNLVSDVFQNNLIIKNLIYPEKTTKSGIKPMKEVEVPPQIKKFIQETTKNRKPSENFSDSTISQKATSAYKNKKKIDGNRKRNDTKGKRKVHRIQSSDEDYSDNNTDLDHSDVQIINSTLEDDDGFTDGEGSVDVMSKKSTDAKKHSKDETNSSNMIKIDGKKTAKVMPLRQVTKIPPKSDAIRSSKEKEYIQKSKSTSRFDSPTDLSVVGGKRNYSNAFEKYFICSEKIYEHNDSMDSDSSSDDDNLFSHFIDLRRKNRGNGEVIDETVMPEHNEEVLNQTESNIEQRSNANTEDNTIISELGEVIKNIITTDLPKWTCHAVPENSVICLLLLERETNGTYDVRKSIEINDHFNANVYVNKKLVSEYCGVYDSYDAIKNLIYQVELL